MRSEYSCKACLGIYKPTQGKRGSGLYIKPLYNSGGTILLGVPRTAQTPFAGVLQGAGASMSSRSLGEVENKLKNLTLKPIKGLRKNIKINF